MVGLWGLACDQLRHRADRRDATPLPSPSGPLLADPDPRLQRSGASEGNPAVPIPVAEGSATSGVPKRCPRRVEKAFFSGCENDHVAAGIRAIWSWWRTCAELSGSPFHEEDQVRMRILVTNGQASIVAVEPTDGIPSAVVSCLSGTARATTFRHSKACEIELVWSPLPAADCPKAVPAASGESTH